MTANEYLAALLVQQDLSDAEVKALQSLRDQIQGQLSILQGNPRFYYAGSYGKQTMIRQRYDLDIVIYWPHAVTYPIKGIYDAVGQELQKHWKVVRSKTVSWELPFEGSFHVDVVPGRALDGSFREQICFGQIQARHLRRA
jgi:tRNA nucleotidyltransferase (CCA-adding enzyme)